MPPCKHFAMKFANQWASKEQALHTAFSHKNISGDEIAKSLHYFQVARTFRNLKNEKNRTFIAVNVIEFSKNLKEDNFPEKVDGLSSAFEEKFGSRNISAASKLLWLRKRSPVIIFDKWAKIAIEKIEDRKIENYKDYSELWKKHYSQDKAKIRSAANSLIKVQEYSGMWDLSTSKYKEAIQSDWFLERVFDMRLLYFGKQVG